MRLEIGKTYRTRRGRKVEIVAFREKPFPNGGPFIGTVYFGKTAELFNFYEDGRFLEDPGSQIDIVGEIGHPVVEGGLTQLR